MRSRRTPARTHYRAAGVLRFAQDDNFVKSVRNMPYTRSQTNRLLDCGAGQRDPRTSVCARARIGRGRFRERLEGLPRSLDGAQERRPHSTQRSVAESRAERRQARSRPACQRTEDQSRANGRRDAKPAFKVEPPQANLQPSASTSPSPASAAPSAPSIPSSRR